MSNEKNEQHPMDLMNRMNSAFAAIFDDDAVLDATVDAAIEAKKEEGGMSIPENAPPELVNAMKEARARTMELRGDFTPDELALASRLAAIEHGLASLIRISDQEKRKQIAEQISSPLADIVAKLSEALGINSDRLTTLTDKITDLAVDSALKHYQQFKRRTNGGGDGGE